MCFVIDFAKVFFFVAFFSILYGGDMRKEIPCFGVRVSNLLIFWLAIYTVLDDESDFQDKIAQFRRPEVENRDHFFCFLFFFPLLILQRRIHRKSWEILGNPTNS